MGSVVLRVFRQQEVKKMLLKQAKMVCWDMRVSCPQDAKKMLLKQARMVNWKKWAA